MEFGYPKVYNIFKNLSPMFTFQEVFAQGSILNRGQFWDLEEVYLMLHTPILPSIYYTKNITEPQDTDTTPSLLENQK